MQRKIHVTAILQNPEGIFEDDYRADFTGVPPQHLEAAATDSLKQFAKQINLVGLYREISATELEVIPTARIRSLTIKIDSLSIASNADLVAATGSPLVLAR